MRIVAPAAARANTRNTETRCEFMPTQLLYDAPGKAPHQPAGQTVPSRPVYSRIGSLSAA